MSLVAEAPEHRRAATRVVVQQRQRLFREGISQLLAAEHDVDVVATASTESELLQACQLHRPGAAVVEAATVDWDPLRIIGPLRRASPSMAVVGLAASNVSMQEEVKARRGGMAALVSRNNGIAGILEALRTSGAHSAARRLSSTSQSTSLPPPSTLTNRELEVLCLVGAGLTSNGVSSRLQISHKTVENHKQRIFAKLGVQNQAHAVSVAIRTGLMRPDRVIDLAVGD